MGLSVMLWGAEKLVPVEYWCPYGKPFQKLINFETGVHNKIILRYKSSDYNCQSKILM